MSYNKETVKEYIELEDVYTLLEYLDAEPELYSDHIVARTICHGGDSHKLYYYENTGLFKCFTGDCGTFDIFELLVKVNHIDLNEAINFAVFFFSLDGKVEATDMSFDEDWTYLRKAQKLLSLQPKGYDKLVLPEHDSNILEYYPQPLIANWKREGIEKEVCDFMNIRYDPVNGGILIPHYDENDRMIGIRIRTLLEEQEKFGKYRPWKHDGQLFNHPLGFNLYGLSKAKENIEKAKLAIVVESEKAVLQYISYFGIANDLCVAVCGSSLHKYQFQMLQELGVTELVIGFDRDFEERGSQEYLELQGKWEKIWQQYSSLVNISFLWDKDDILDYKSSPLDHGAKAFEYLFRNRVYL